MLPIKPILDQSTRKTKLWAKGTVECYGSEHLYCRSWGRMEVCMVVGGVSRGEKLGL